MELDWLVFPTPDSSYSHNKSSGELIYIPKQRDKLTHIPCLFLRSTTTSICPKFAIFFHGNAEDINLAYEILNHIRYTLGVIEKLFRLMF
jgi:hypothetical protein